MTTITKGSEYFKKRKKKKDKEKYDEAYSTVVKPTDKKKKSDLYGTPFSSKPGQKVKKLYWDPETKKYLPPPGVKEAKAKLVDLDHALCSFQVIPKSLDHLKDLIKRVKKIKSVTGIYFS